MVWTSHQVCTSQRTCILCPPLTTILINTYRVSLLVYIAIASGSPCAVPSDENKCIPLMTTGTHEVPLIVTILDLTFNRHTVCWWYNCCWSDCINDGLPLWLWVQLMVKPFTSWLIVKAEHLYRFVKEHFCWMLLLRENTTLVPPSDLQH